MGVVPRRRSLLGRSGAGSRPDAASRVPDPGASWADADDDTTGEPVSAELEVVERGAPGDGFTGGAGREHDSFAMEDEGSEEVALDPRLNLKAEPATEIIDRDQLAALAADDDVVTMGPAARVAAGSAASTLPPFLPLGAPDPKTEVIRRAPIVDVDATEETVPTSLPTLAEIERHGGYDPLPDPTGPDLTGPTPQDLLALPPPEPGDGSYAIDIGFARPIVPDDRTVPLPGAAVGPTRPEVPTPAPTPAPASNAPALPDPPPVLRGEDAATIAIQTEPAPPVPAPPPHGELPHVASAGVPIATAPTVSPLVGVLALVGSGGVLAVALIMAVAVAIGSVVVLTLDPAPEPPDAPPPLPPIELGDPAPAPDPTASPEPPPEPEAPEPAPTRRRAPEPEPVAPAPAPEPAPEPVVTPPPPPPPEPVEDDKKRGLFRKKK